MIKGRLKNLIINILLSAGSVFFIFLISELAVRIFCPQVQTEPLFQYNEDTITSLRKNATVISTGPEYKVTYMMNSKGLRSPEYSYPKDKGIIRILGLGDSYTFGIGVEEKDTYLKKLEEMLAARFQKERKIEMINTGVGGWGTTQQLIYLQKEGLKYTPDLIILGFFVNDPSENEDTGLYRLENDGLIRQPVKISQGLSATKKFTAYIPFYNFLTRHSQFLSFLRIRLTIILTKGHQKAGIAKLTDGTYKNLDLTKALLKEMNQVAEANGSKLIIILIPSKEEFLLPNSSDRNMQLEIVKFCQDNYIKNVDLFLTFKKISDTQSLYFTKDSHWNERGHRLCAHTGYNYIKNYNLLP